VKGKKCRHKGKKKERQTPGKEEIMTGRQTTVKEKERQNMNKRRKKGRY